MSTIKQNVKYAFWIALWVISVITGFAVLLVSTDAGVDSAVALGRSGHPVYAVLWGALGLTSLIVSIALTAAAVIDD